MADKKKKFPVWIKVSSILINVVAWPLILFVDVKEDGFVSKEMYGDKWPLTVDSGTLSCVSAENLDDHLWAYETFFTTGEKKYTVYSREAQDGLFEGKKPKYPYWDELKLTTEKLNILGLPSAKDVKFLESKARGLCREYDNDGISRYKLVPAWQRKDRKKQGLSVYILK